jgi:THO complex subunit 3
MGKPCAFKTEVNEIAWNNSGNLFFTTTGNGTVEVYDYTGKGLSASNKLTVLTAHTQNCYCIKFDPKDKYFAVGTADALVSIWDLSSFTCVRTLDLLEWPVRTLGFSADGQYLAAGSEDLFVEIASVATGESVHQIPCEAATNALAWHPKLPILAYGCDQKESMRDR